MIDKFSDSQVKKALVSIAIEEALLDFGKPTLEFVSNKLKKDYNCYVPDCYEHPEYLKRILQDLYGNAHIQIIESIKQKLDEFAYQDSIKQFLEIIR